MAKSQIDVKGKEGGEVLVHEESPMYCRESGVVTTIPTGGNVAAGTDLIGQPVSGSGAAGFTLLAGGSEASATGIIIGGPPVGAITAQNTALPYEYSVLVRGPAAVNPDAFAANDSVGGGLDAAAISAALAGLDVPIISLTPPVKEETQST